MTFTKEEIQYIQTVQGKTVREIATKLGRSYTSTMSAIVRYEGSYIKTVFQWEDEEDQALQEMKEHGEYSLQEMADRIGRTAPSVAMRLKLLNLAVPQTKWTSEQEACVILMYKAGNNPQDIAEVLELRLNAVAHKIKKLKKLGVL